MRPAGRESPVRPAGRRGGAPGTSGGAPGTSSADRAIPRTDADRVVDLSDEGPLLPEQTSDDTDRGWGDQRGSNDAWLLAERPPHWD